ncbi:uncharacterized protein LOC108600836 [Drosophila busckii]|uniref:uncharacterized protein LOC108600836 n=1 Tax=Drosophila busckii TaxID=30019 RepID=UPI00083E9900|nr:uncharacterized protein LOC108600836 [Drosophila busckii]
MQQRYLTLMDLNDDCLAHILKLLPSVDQYNFGQTCVRLRELLKQRACQLYPIFQLQWSRKLTSEQQIMLKLFLNIYERLQQLVLDVDMSNELLLVRLSNMQNLESFAINEIAHDKCNARIFEALNALPKLQSIYAQCKITKAMAASLIKLKQLKELRIRGSSCIKLLVEICKSNSELRVLTLGKQQMSLQLIVPHCKELQQIDFSISHADCDYAALATLPKLKKMCIHSQHANLSWRLRELLNALAAATQLSCLKLQTNIDLQLTSSVLKLKHLRELELYVEEKCCISLLTALSQLERLHIRLDGYQHGQEILSVVMSCPKLQRLELRTTQYSQFALDLMQVLRAVRSPKQQKPLELYIWRLLDVGYAVSSDLFDSAYCTVLTKSSSYDW